ncbi:hypothetical protein EC973_007604 [Apophysomyces ossiformis]|uniref:PSP1 C-terminal domain-containing protein n=1 Tax=Apophysomyces ossiformis TaxID=679940 RepID=A0A8H7EPN3_9FUNG|nr:hypothetical protein EC973_007604 [Apophysomyces ossiformis]
MAIHVKTGNSPSVSPRLGPDPPSEQYASFGGFQWEGPSIFEENSDRPVEWEPTAEEGAYDILSVPMLPGVSMEPIYRQQRSLSFSMGQDPSFFGYDDYEEEEEEDNYTNQRFKNALETMQEEEELEDEDSQAEARIRTRSKSSGAALNLLSSTQHAHLSRMSSQQESQTRASPADVDSQIAATGEDNQQSLHSDDVPLSRQNNDDDRLSSLHRRQSLTIQEPIQQLAHRVEDTHLHSDNFSTVPSAAFCPDMFSYMPAPPPHVAYNSQQAQPLPPPPSFIHPSSPPTAEETESGTRPYQEMGKGVPLHRVPREAVLYMIEFKAGRTDFFYVSDRTGRLQPQVGNLVIVEADRGQDLGKVAVSNLTSEQVKDFHMKKQHQQQQEENESSEHKRDIQVKRIYRLAAADEVDLLPMKDQDEQRALALCQEKTKLRKLPMEVVDAEYQWDRRKLTFYFVADRRIDFRELVRELFKIYKTRIWMCARQKNHTS